MKKFDAGKAEPKTNKIGKTQATVEPPPAAPGADSAGANRAQLDERIHSLPISRVAPCPLNPRKNYSAQKITELAGNISEMGIVHALLVRPVEPTLVQQVKGEADGPWYEVVAGHRRLKAAQEAGFQEVPCVIRDITDTLALDLMLSENLQREDLTPIEEAEGMQSMLDLKDADGNPVYTL